MELDNKISVITGGSSGIGKAIVHKFSEKGSYVHILDISPNETLVSEINSNGMGKAEFHHCDVSVRQEVKSVIEGILQNHKIDILVNNAGIAHIGDLEKTSEADLDRLYAVNVKGVYNCMQSCILSMVENGGGVILNMSSVAASVGIKDRFAYSMTKGAVRTMTFSVAKDYVDKNIRCNCISPARVHTPFVDNYLRKNFPENQEDMFEKLSRTQPVGRMGTPEEVAELALFLCSEKASFITGSDYPVDGGFIKLNT